MATINQLAQATLFSDGDLLVGWTQVNGDTRGVPGSVLANYLLTKFPGGTGPIIKQYYAPSVTGWNVTVNAQPQGTNYGANAWLIITPTAGFAAGTITLPSAQYCMDQQKIIVCCTQSVTALTIAPNGAAAVINPSTTLAAGGFFEMRFDQVTQTWYRVG